MESEACECNGTYVTVDEKGNKQPCRCYVKKYMKAKFKILGNLLIDDKVKKISDCIDIDKNLLIMSKKHSLNRIRGLIACLWLKANLRPSLEFMSCYRLVDIYLDKDLEYKNMSHIKQDILAITWGYNEFRNSRIPELITHVLGTRSGKYNWLFCRRDQEDMSVVYDYLRENNYIFYDLDTKYEKHHKSLFD